MATDSIPQKRCNTCKEMFPATREYFSPDKKSRDELKSDCKKCRSIANGEYFKQKMSDPEWAAKRRQQSLESFHKRNAKDPEKYEQSKTRKRKQHKLKREQTPDFNEQRRAKRNIKRENELRSIRRANDPEYKERTNKGTRERRAANPDYWRLKSRIYAAKRRSQMGTEHYTNADIDLQYKSQNGKCWHCGKKLNGKYHIDHLIALSRGGTDKATNIVISCRDCNESKHNKMTWEWNGKLL